MTRKRKTRKKKGLTDAQREELIGSVIDEIHSNGDFAQQVAENWISNGERWHAAYWKRYHR